MPPASSSKKKFSIGSFASPKTRTTPDPEALQRLMKKTEVEGGGVLGTTTDSEVVAKPPIAIHSVGREAEPELEAVASTPEIAPPPVPTLPTGRSRGRGTKEEPRVRAKDGERLRQTSIIYRLIFISAFGNTPSTKRSRFQRSWSMRFAHGSTRAKGRATGADRGKSSFMSLLETGAHSLHLKRSATSCLERG